MKVNGDEQTGFLGTTQGTAANFSIKLSADGDTRVELPINPESWDESFQAGEDGMPTSEEQPGFLFMAAIATMTLAAVYLPNRHESQETND